MFNKKHIFIAVSVLLILGLVSGIGFANGVIINDNKENIKLEDALQEDVGEKNAFDEMAEIMDNNGYRDMGRHMRHNDLMDNFTQEDFDEMIKIMRGNSYDIMADRMESIGREDMIQMHESMEGHHRRNGRIGGPMMGRHCIR